MAVEAFDWNVVVVGYWNPAILTPGGIGKRLFDLEKGTPIAVEIPLDGLAPYRVKHEGLTVTAELGKLALVADIPSLANLDRARKLAAKAITDLPETPLTACGFNIRVRFTDAPEKLLTGTKAALDDWLSDANFTIASRATLRSIDFKGGALNLAIRQISDTQTHLELNFDRQSGEAAALSEWLAVPMVDVRTASTQVLKLFGVDFEEKWQ